MACHDLEARSLVRSLAALFPDRAYTAQSIAHAASLALGRTVRKDQAWHWVYQVRGPLKPGKPGPRRRRGG